MLFYKLVTLFICVHFHKQLDVLFTFTVSQQPGIQGYGDPSVAMTMPLAPAYPGQPSAAHMMNSYPPPPSYCNHPPPSYDQVFKTTEKK